MVAPGAADPLRYRDLPAAARHFVRNAPGLCLVFTLSWLTSCAAPSGTPAPVASLAPTTAPPPSIQQPEPPPPPEALIGADRETIAMRLGKPVFLMRAQTSEIWQYRAKGCVLDLFLYEDQGAMRVTYIEARDLAGAAVAPADCLRAVHAVREPWPDVTTTGT